MKPKTTLRQFLALAGSSLLAMSSASAATLYFDGSDTGTPNGASAITSANSPHTWDTTTANWDNGVSYVAWNNANADDAVISGSGGGNKTISITTPITVGALTLNSSGGTTFMSGSEITINSGIAFGNHAGISWTAPVLLGGSQTWSIGGSNSTGKNISGGTNLNGHTLTWDSTTNAANRRPNHSAITGNGNFIKDGSGWALLSNNTYTGTNTVNDGTLLLGSSAALGNANNQLTVNGGTLDMTNQNQTVGNLTGTGGVITSTHNSGTRLLTIGSGDNGGGNFQGVIEDGVTGSTTALTKIGTGTITLSGANTYSGATTVTGGTLLINNTTGSGTVSVGVSGTLGGTGTIAGATTVDGNLNPGASPGVLSFSDSLTLAASSITTFEIDGTTRGTEYDGVNVGTSLELGGSLILDLGTVLLADATFNLFDATGSTSGDFSAVSLTGDMGSGSFGFDSADVWTLVDGGNTWTFTQSAGTLDFDGTFGPTVIPEPSTALLGALGLLALLRRMR